MGGTLTDSVTKSKSKCSIIIRWANTGYIKIQVNRFIAG